MSYVPAFEPASVRDVAKFHVSLSCWPMDKQTPSSAQTSLQTQNTCQERTLGLVRLSKRHCALVEWQGSADSALCKVWVSDIWVMLHRCKSNGRSRPSPQAQPESFVERQGCGTLLPFVRAGAWSAFRDRVGNFCSRAFLGQPNSRSTACWIVFNVLKQIKAILVQEALIFSGIQTSMIKRLAFECSD